MKNLGYLVLPILLIMAAQDLASAQPQQARSKIKAAAVLSLSGDAAIDGKNIARGLKLAQNDLAALGLNVELSFQDDQTQPKQSLTAMRFLLEQRRPDVIIGPIWSFLINAAAPAITAGGVCTFIPSATTEITNFQAPNLLYGTVKNSLKAQPAADWLKAHKIRRAAIIVSDDLWGASHEEAYRAAARQAGAEIAAAEKIQFGVEESALASILAKIAAKKPEVILWTGYDTGAQILLSAKHKLKLTIPIIGTEGLRRVVNSGAAGLEPNDEIYVFSLPSRPEFQSEFQAKFGEAPGSYAENAYEGLMQIGRAALRRGAGTQALAELVKEPGEQNEADFLKFDQNGDLVGGVWELNKLTLD